MAPIDAPILVCRLSKGNGQIAGVHDASQSFYPVEATTFDLAAADVATFVAEHVTRQILIGLPLPSLTNCNAL